MKTLFKFFLLLLIVSISFACSSSSEEEIIEDPKELKLSVPLMDKEWLTTEDIDFEFEILDGNGEYTATVSEFDGDPDAIVTIDNNKVIVNLLVGNHNGAEITITDKMNKSATIYVTSTNKTLHIPNYGLFLDEGSTYSMDVQFGAGAPYTIEKIKGNASQAIIEDNKVKATSLGLGNTYYKIKDKRGSIARLEISTTLQFEMDITTNYFEFDEVNRLSSNIKLSWGTEWEIVGSTDKVTENVLISKVLISTGVWSDYYVLFINTTDKGKGTDTITLKNKEGDLVVVKIRVR